MPSDNNSILSQDEIDAMIQGGGGGGTAPPEPDVEPVVQPPVAEVPQAVPEQAPAAVVQVAPAPPVSAAPGVSKEMFDGLAGALKAAMERMATLEAALAESNASVRQTQQEFGQVIEQVQMVGSKVEGIMINLKATLGYRAQKTFTCSACQVSGQVAAKVQCTSCGDENWWGWWTQEG